ncbi:MAG: hypothetical protein JRI68_08825 [Deltaproteobacteria bacterium]|nr:hypothetical protein [Deltaproteobacteria bacterium]
MGIGTTKVLAGVALLLVGLTLSNAILADAVGPPPKTCPPGAWGQTTHYGPHCAPHTCTTDTECKTAQKCRPHALCVSEQTHEHWRGNTHVVRVTGDCAKGEACPEGSECRKASYCMPTAPTPPPASAKPTAEPAAPSESSTPDTPPASTPPTKSCGACAAVGSTPNSSPLAVAVLVLAALGLRRRGRG